MIPDPLHPAVVHLPVALVVLLPLFAAGALVAIRRGASPLRAWGLVVALAGLLFVGAFAAVRTGEAQEEAVEEVVPESAIHTHEEAAELFLVLAGITGVLTAGGLLRGRLGNVGRGVATGAILGLLVAGVRVGGSGGDLVYRHGAAAAHAGTAAGIPGVGVDGERGAGGAGPVEEGDREEDGEDAENEGLLEGVR